MIRLALAAEVAYAACGMREPSQSEEAKSASGSALLPVRPRMTLLKSYEGVPPLVQKVIQQSRKQFK